MSGAAAANTELRVRAWVEAQLGGATSWARPAERGEPGEQGEQGGQGGGAWVRAVTGPDGRRWIVKRHRSRRGFEQELHALRAWLGGRDRWGGVRVPSVRAAEPSVAALLVEHLDGRPASDGPDELDSVHHAAGRFLAQLHALAAPDPDPLALADALERRLAAWRARASLDRRQAEIVAALGPRPALFEGARRVPCHRDFAPRNWLWDGAELAVIDFEHARLDHALVDLTKLCVDVWPTHAGAQRAFWAGYGRGPTELERRQLRALLVVHGLASLAWGQARGVSVHVDEGERALERAAQGLP